MAPVARPFCDRIRHPLSPLFSSTVLHRKLGFPVTFFRESKIPSKISFEHGTVESYRRTWSKAPLSSSALLYLPPRILPPRHSFPPSTTFTLSTPSLPQSSSPFTPLPFTAPHSHLSSSSTSSSLFPFSPPPSHQPSWFPPLVTRLKEVSHQPTPQWSLFIPA